jgi:hypothetical protein
MGKCRRSGRMSLLSCYTTCCMLHHAVCAVLRFPCTTHMRYTAHRRGQVTASTWILVELLLTCCGLLPAAVLCCCYACCLCLAVMSLLLLSTW